MPQSLARLLVHTVFSTKERRPFLRDPAPRQELHRYLGGILKNLGCQPIIVGGIEDHVHLLARASQPWAEWRNGPMTAAGQHEDGLR
jgi:REP element-mobilizing transposase RayT